MIKLGILLVLLLSIFVVPLRSAAQTSRTVDWVAFHAANDRGWAAETGLSPRDVRNLRHAAGIADDEPSNPLLRIDARTLSYNRVLLVNSVGDRHCLEVNVLDRSFRNFKKIWSTRELPDGSSLCPPPQCRDLAVHAVKKNQIEILVPVQLENAVTGICDEEQILTYRAKGSTYILESSKRRPKRCFIEDHRRIVQLALSGSQNSAVAPEPAVMVTFFPSFAQGYSIVLEKTASGFVINRLSFTGSLRAKLDICGEFKTPSQCLAAAGSLPVERTTIHISSNDIARLLDDLHKIDLHTDTCPRLLNGMCAMLEDGSSYLLTMEDGQSVELANVENSKNLISENQALVHWLNNLRQLVKAHEQGY